MKKFISSLVLISLISPTFSFAEDESKTCRDIYQEKIWTIEKFEDAGGLIGLTSFTSGLITGLAATSVGFAFVGAAVPVAGFVTTVVIHNAKPKKMIKLIDEANAIINNPDSIISGKHLNKLHKQVNRSNNISIHELAMKIYNGNKNLSFCSYDSLSYNQIKRFLKINASLI